MCLHERMRVHGVVKVKMKMRPAIMRVPVNVDALSLSQSDVQKPRTQRDDHQCHTEFENVCHSFRNNDAKNQYHQTRNQKRRRVTHTPESANARRTPYRTPFADNCGDGRQVVRFCGVLHSKCETQAESEQYRVLHPEENLYRS
jgi:hypothetical protein